MPGLARLGPYKPHSPTKPRVMLSYLSLLPVCSLSLPSVLSLFNPSFARPPHVMPVQSKVLSPIDISSGSEETTYHADSRVFWSKAPASHMQNNRRTLVKRESGISSGPKSIHNHVPCLASASSSARHPRASDLASASAPVHHSRQPLVLTSRENRHPQPVFPSHENIDTSESLHTENASLRRELDSLYDAFETISYVLITLLMLKITQINRPAKTTTSSLKKWMRRRKKSKIW